MKKEKNLLLGAHMSISGGISKSIDIAEEIGCTTMQIFTKSNRSWAGKKITEKDSKEFQQRLKNSSLSEVMVHASYLINISSPKIAIANKSLKALKEELERCDQLGIKYLVLHPGSHLGSGEKEGIKKIAEGLDQALKETKCKAMVLLENSAGQGSNIGSSFGALKEIYNQAKHKKNIGVCFDTCHAFAAGYDISTEEEYKKTWKLFSENIGLDLLKAIHLNDSKAPLGSKLDRHEKIGKGKIDKAAFKLIMQDEKLQNVPKILETPVVDNPLKEYREEIQLLKSLYK